MALTNYFTKKRYDALKGDQHRMMKMTQFRISNDTHIQNDVLNGQRYWKLRERLGK